MRLIDADKLKEDVKENGCDRFETWDKMLTLAEYETFVGDVIDNAPTVEDRTREVLSLQATIRKLTKERPHIVRCKDCIHRDPEDKKCDCSRLERQGKPFGVHDNYYCAYAIMRGEE